MSSDAGIRKLKEVEAQAQKRIEDARKEKDEKISAAFLEVESQMAKGRKEMELKLSQEEAKLKEEAAQLISQLSLQVSEKIKIIQEMTERNKNEAINLLLDTVTNVKFE